MKIGLTATPALHTAQIFGAPVFNYSYREAVIDGYLVIAPRWFAEPRGPIAPDYLVRGPRKGIGP